MIWGFLIYNYNIHNFVVYAVLDYTNTASSKYFPAFYAFLLDDLAFKHKWKFYLLI